MTDSRAAMVRELKICVIPRLRELGFTGSFPHFRRSRDPAFDLLTFQFDRDGGGYMIEIAQCPKEGIVTSWGKSIAASDAKAWDVNPSRRKRIGGTKEPGTEGWFRFDQRPHQALATSTLTKLSDETIWQDLPPIAPRDKLHLHTE
jgi:hypothetical protein